MSYHLQKSVEVIHGQTHILKKVWERRIFCVILFLRKLVIRENDENIEKQLNFTCQ